jgi:hypothetical protein
VCELGCAMCAGGTCACAVFAATPCHVMPPPCHTTHAAPAAAAHVHLRLQVLAAQLALGSSPVVDLLAALPACQERALTVPMDETSALIDGVSWLLLLCVRQCGHLCSSCCCACALSSIVAHHAKHNC